MSKKQQLLDDLVGFDCLTFVYEGNYPDYGDLSKTDKVIDGSDLKPTKQTGCHNNLVVEIKLTAFGDYNGTTIERSNFEVMWEEWGKRQGVLTANFAFNATSIFIAPAFVNAKYHEDLIDLVENFETSDRIDEQHFLDLESRLVEEWLTEDGIKEIRELWTPAFKYTDYELITKFYALELQAAFENPWTPYFHELDYDQMTDDKNVDDLARVEVEDIADFNDNNVNAITAMSLIKMLTEDFGIDTISELKETLENQTKATKEFEILDRTGKESLLTQFPYIYQELNV